MNPFKITTSNTPAKTLPRHEGPRVGSGGGGDAGRLFGTALQSAAGFMTGGLSSVGMGSLFGGFLGGGGGGGQFASFERLINKQIEVQTRMQVYSSRSNIAKTEHETAMTAIRNMRA